MLTEHEATMMNRRIAELEQENAALKAECNRLDAIICTDQDMYETGILKDQKSKLIVQLEALHAKLERAEQVLKALRESSLSRPVIAALHESARRYEENK